ncbi:alpha-N-acetylglucosaminidase [Lipingzhangella halophila]|uniref:Alpha-N-acetylglucosaminidase n=1 Tax=Lipingzhangella halophila TaxID=1783352 RepID=A0A7W7RMR2_9ACTN|nr:alpha-N-acetylglucosaminidase [Lipingzhangella halophila]MBB4934627.1 alpha-N-acetylglucosaminidase [Lipingzhangella halophila]
MPESDRSRATERAADQGGGAGGELHGVPGLLRRLLGARDDEFALVSLPPDGTGDTFEVETAGPRVELRGTSPVAQASALRWYLANACGSDVSWDTRTVIPPARLPRVPRVRRTTPFRYRYRFNFCVFSYTTAFWGWPEWEREIDWMALHGINLPLAITGHEAAWQAVYRQLGMADDDVRTFLGGPAYLPFTWMGCTQGWGGPLPQSWIDAHEALGRRIVERERELGMRPVQQAFAGHVPPEIGGGHPREWFGFQTRLLDPRDPRFRRIGELFVTEQTRRFGTDHIYAADPFIETTPPASDPDELAGIGRAVHESMAGADPEAVWVLQSWPFNYRGAFWTPERISALLGAVSEDRMLLLDLWAEQRPMWRETSAFHGKPWVWCALPNFGGRPGMHGKLPRAAGDLADALDDPDRGRLRGLGQAMEDTTNDPAVYEFLADLVWRDSATADPDQWVRGYARRRYGRRLPEAEQAWSALLRTVYGNRRSGRPPASIVIDRPVAPGEPGPTGPPQPRTGRPEWEPAGLVDAWHLLLAAATPESAGGPYGRDLVDVSQQVLALLARVRHGRVLRAYNEGGAAETRRSADAFLEVLRDLDTLLATRREYLLGPWIDRARTWGDTPEERRLLEWNARRIITVWGPRDSPLRDYAGRHWSGLVADYHLARWRIWSDHLTHALSTGTSVDPAALNRELTDSEEAWCAAEERYPDHTQGDTVQVAQRLLATYDNDVAALAERGRALL